MIIFEICHTYWRRAKQFSNFDIEQYFASLSFRIYRQTCYFWERKAFPVSVLESAVLSAFMLRKQLSHSQQYGDPLLIPFLNLQLEGTAQIFVFFKAMFALLGQLSLNISRERNTTSTYVATKQRITGKNTTS